MNVEFWLCDSCGAPVGSNYLSVTITTAGNARKEHLFLCPSCSENWWKTVNGFQCAVNKTQHMDEKELLDFVKAKVNPKEKEANEST